MYILVDDWIILSEGYSSIGRYINIVIHLDTKIETPLVIKPKTPSTVEIKYK